MSVYTSVTTWFFVVLSPLHSVSSQCDPGTYHDYDLASCQPCPIGSYQEDVNQTHCNQCEIHQTTLQTGATTPNDCISSPVGCYANVTVNLGEVPNIHFNSMTVLKCAEFCMHNGKQYAAITNGDMCICRRGIPSSSVDMNECNLPCVGDSTELCGGPTTFIYYAIHLFRTTISIPSGETRDLSPYGIAGNADASLHLEARGCRDAMITLYNKNMQRLVQVVFGGNKNTWSGIRNATHYQLKAYAYGTHVNCSEFRYFKLEWSNSTITAYNADGVLASWSPPYDVPISRVVLSNFNNDICYRIWSGKSTNEDDTCPTKETTISETTSTTLPSATVNSFFVVCDPTKTNSPVTNTCPCFCETITISQQELQTKITEMKKELTIDKRTTQKFKMKFTSAHDDRPSARGIGVAFGPVILAVVVGGVVCLDIPNILRSFNTLRRSCKRKKKYSDIK